MSLLCIQKPIEQIWFTLSVCVINIYDRLSLCVENHKSERKYFLVLYSYRSRHSNKYPFGDFSKFSGFLTRRSTQATSFLLELEPIDIGKQQWQQQRWQQHQKHTIRGQIHTALVILTAQLWVPNWYLKPRIDLPLFDFEHN